jgi:hypothetical protein
MARGVALPTNPHRLTGAARQARALELRVLGWTYDEIAREIGYKSRGAVGEAIKAALARREKPAADELARIHMDRLELAARSVMRRIGDDQARGNLTAGQLSKHVLSLTRILAQQARYVDVYSEGQGLGPVVSLLDQLLRTAPVGADPDDPMTVSPVDSPE